MPLDPYATLNVKRDATPEQIKRAYRKAAMKAHPDRGGDAEKFHQVQLAYEVLSDPARRERYDSTGEINPSAVDNRLSLLLSVLSSLYTDVMQALFNTKRPPGTVDIVQQMQETLRARQKEIGDRIRHIERVSEYIKESRPRFSANGDNLMDLVIEAQLGQLNAQAQPMREQMELFKEAGIFLKRAKYRKDSLSKSVFGMESGELLKKLAEGETVTGTVNWSTSP